MVGYSDVVVECTRDDLYANGGRVGSDRRTAFSGRVTLLSGAWTSWNEIRMNAGGANFVGRVEELELVRRAITSGRSCMLIGPPGIGKSTLLGAVVESLPGSRWTPVLHGLEILSGTPLAPWQELLEGIASDGDDEEELADAAAVVTGDRVILVEDVHLFDPMSLAVLDLVSTSKVVLLTGRSPLDQYEMRLPGLTAIAEAIDVPQLSESEASLLVRRLRPGASTADVTRMVRDGGGNPLFTEFSARVLDPVASPHPIVSAVTGLGIEHHRSLALLVAAETDLPRREVAEHEVLVSAGLAVLLDHRSVRIAHSCVADTARDVLDPAILADAHRRLSSLTDDPLLIARHLLHAGEAQEARDVAISAAQTITMRDKRAALYDLAAVADPERRPDILVEAAEALVDAGRCDRGVDLARTARCSDPDLERRRLTALARGAWSSDMPDKDAALAALALTDPDQHPVETIQLRSILTRITGRIEWNAEAALEHARAGLLVSERHGLDATEASGAMGTALLVALSDGWRDHLHTAIAAARRQGDLRAELIAFDTLFVGELVFGEMDRCLPLAESALQLAIERKIPFAVDRFRVNLLLGRMVLSDDPRDVASEALELLRKPLSSRMRNNLSIIALHSLGDCGRDLDGRDLMSAPSRAPGDPTGRALRAIATAELHLAAGRAEDALATATECLEYPVLGFPAHQMAAPVRSWAARDLGIDPPSEVGPGFPNAEPFRLEAKAIDALETDPAGALVMFRAAIDMWGEHQNRYTLRCRLGLTSARLASGDRMPALADARSLAATCDELGFVALARRARELVRRHGGRVNRRLESRSGLVTGAQEELLGLVLEGLTTSEIASRLRVSTSTVDSSIASAQTALGSKSRLAAAIRVQSARSAPHRRVMRYSSDRSLVRTVAARDTLRAVVRELHDAPRIPWTLPPSVVWTIDLIDEDGAADTLRGALRGASLLVWLGAAEELNDRFLADAERLVDIEVLPGSNGLALSPEQLRLQELLSRGWSVVQIAAELDLSRRTAERRLVRLRELHGVDTNAELAVIHEPVGAAASSHSR